MGTWKENLSALLTSRAPFLLHTTLNRACGGRVRSCGRINAPVNGAYQCTGVQTARPFYALCKPPKREQIPAREIAAGGATPHAGRPVGAIREDTNTPGGRPTHRDTDALHALSGGGAGGARSHWVIYRTWRVDTHMPNVCAGDTYVYKHIHTYKLESAHTY